MGTRATIAITLFLGANSVFAQDLSKHVSFAAPAARAAILFPTLSKQLGIELKTVAQTEDEVLLINVKDVPIQDLLDRIAKAANAQWKKEKQVFRLVRPPSLSTKAANFYIERRTALFQRYLDAEAADSKTQPEWNSTQASSLAKSLKDLLDDPGKQRSAPREYQKQEREVQRLAPVTSAIQRLLQQIGARELASFDPNQRVVFALHPNEMQLPLGIEAEQILSQFVSQQFQYAEAFAQQPSDNPFASRRRFSEMPSKGPGSPSLGIGQAILVWDQSSVKVFGTGVGAVATLVVADKSGATLAFGSHTITRRFPDPPSMEAADSSQEITLSPTAQAFLKATGQEIRFGAGMDEMPTMFIQVEGIFGGVGFVSKVNRGPKGPDTPPDLKAKLLQPQIFDPLSLFVGEVLASGAEVLGLNIVADLPDTCLQGLSQAFQNGNRTVKAQRLFETEAPRAELAVDKSNGWIVVSPKDHEDADRAKADRNALAQLVQTINLEHGVSLDALGAFVLKQQKRVSPSDLDGIVLQVCCGSLGGKAAAALRNPDPIRIYATLMPGARPAMIENKSIPLDRLTLDQKRWLADDSFNSMDGPVITSSELSPAASHTRGSFSGIPTIQSERTEILPHGIQPRGQLEFFMSVSHGFTAIEPESGATAFLTEADIASRLYQRERPELGTPIFYKLYQPSVRATIQFKFVLGDHIELIRRLENTTVAPNTKSLALEDMPDTQKRITDILNLIRNSPIAKVTISGPERTRTIPPL